MSNPINETIYKIVELGNNIQIPEGAERPNTKGWIDFGDNNDYPNYLIELANRSARHSAILKTKANMIGGNGWMKGNLSTQTVGFLKNNNNDPYSPDLDEILARISYDYVLFGAYSLNLIWSKDRSTIADIQYISPAALRVAIPDTNNPDKAGYFISSDWRNLRRNPPVYYPAFDLNNREEGNTILYVKDIHGDYHNRHYGVPTYTGGIYWCEIDYELATYQLNTIKNGFHPRLLINFNQLPPAEEMEKVDRNIKKQHKGTRGELLITTYSDGVENAPKVTQLTANYTDSYFKDTNETIESNIYQAHQINNPSLFGVFTPGELGNTNDLIDSLKLFQTMYLDHKQNDIAKWFNKIAAVNGLPDKLIIEKYNLHLEIKHNIQDLLLVLMSTISNEQKIQVLEAVGYSREQALALCPPDAPTPTAPVPITPVKP